MKILVLSDTHGDIKKAAKAVKANRKIDLIIHLGDYYRDARKISGMFPQIPVEYIYGNCDLIIDNVPSEKTLDICGKRIFMVHGHRYSVKWGYERLAWKAQEQNADIILYGHTHIPEIRNMGNTCFINPGSASEPRNGSGESYAVIEIENGQIRPKICICR